ncbi:hypothetical protein BCR33DRAFT_721996 [Rhizoclosmatium globosum]|uniref:Uncharacterized protein n=1 Tax=Rhizoclosmatium globosum TaxID=329046 RepID=A0A1Y2BNZ8_9FUNG|nr:hypothetical protein BCR33DRAFT_721996 [Rhizoclosmatium globosum]|eukprot:ORY36473.1 hypothetical protein BCR33DRAFT_721996 [Rhizoclosmatium globosum]
MAIFEATTAINYPNMFSNKAQRQQDLISAQQKEIKLQSDIAAQENLLERLVSQQTATTLAQNEWFVIVSKLMVLANDVDEIVYSKALDQSVSDYYETVKATYNAMNALRQVNYCVFAYTNFSRKINYNDDPFPNYMVYLSHHLSNAVANYPSLASVGVNPGLNDRAYREIIDGMFEIVRKAQHYLKQELARLRRDLFEKEATLVKTSNYVRAIRVKLITSLFASCNIFPAESLEVEFSLNFDHRELQSISNIYLDVEPGSLKSVRYVWDTLSKNDIGKAVGILYPSLGGVVYEEESNDLPPYVSSSLE